MIACRDHCQLTFMPSLYNHNLVPRATDTWMTPECRWNHHVSEIYDVWGDRPTSRAPLDDTLCVLPTPSNPGFKSWGFYASSPSGGHVKWIHSSSSLVSCVPHPGWCSIHSSVCCCGCWPSGQHLDFFTGFPSTTIHLPKTLAKG